MANTIGWGQGSVNNTNEWGRGFVNNTIDWGDIYTNSWSPETNLEGGTPPAPIVEDLLFENGIDLMIDELTGLDQLIAE
jgi:hypothetical protein